MSAYPNRNHQAIVALAGLTAMGESFLDHWESDDDDQDEVNQAKAARVEFQVHAALLADCLAERIVLADALAGVLHAIRPYTGDDIAGRPWLLAAHKALECDYCGARAGEDCAPDCLPVPAPDAHVGWQPPADQPWATPEGIAARAVQVRFSTLQAVAWAVGILAAGTLACALVSP